MINQYTSFLTESNIRDLLKIVDVDLSKPFEGKDALIFDKKKGQNTMDLEKRKVKNKNYRSPELLTWLTKNIIEQVNKKLDSNLILMNNMIDVIHYKSGDYFKEHADHKYVISDEFEEYTLIVCLQTVCQV